MFLIASSGRCGTVALAHAFNAHSDHQVDHEEPPRLLEEAWLKHRGQDYRTDDFSTKLARFSQLSGERFGEAFRGCTLLPDIAAAVPTARFLVLIRDPVGYIPSAHFMKVLNKGGSIWDIHRVMPGDDDPAKPLALRLAGHWDEVNRHLLDFAETTPNPVRVALHGPLNERIDGWADFLGVQITDRIAVTTLLAGKPNRSETHELPDGWNEPEIRARTATQWARACRLAEHHATS